MIRWLKRWIASWIMSSNDYWMRNIPTASAIEILQDGKADKNLSYHKKIAGLRKNAAFMNELAELQEKLQRSARNALVANEIEQARMYSAMDAGISKLNGIIINSINKLHEENRG